MASYSLHIFLSYLCRAVDFSHDTGEKISVTVAKPCLGVDGYDYYPDCLCHVTFTQFCVPTVFVFL